MTYNPNHPNADWSGYVQGGSKNIKVDKRAGGDMAAALFGKGPGVTKPPIAPYVKPVNFLGGPAYKDLDETRFRSTTQAMNEGDPTDKGGVRLIHHYFSRRLHLVSS